MLNCRACLWRCIRAVDTSFTRPLRPRHDGFPALVAVQQRAASFTTKPDRKPGRRKPSSASLKPRSDSDKGAKNAALGQGQRERMARRAERAAEEASGSALWYGKRDPRMSSQDWDRRKRELQYLKDPLEVAAFVHKELKKGRMTEMLQLVMMVSHSMQVIVSWNHIINHYLMLGRIPEAFKVFNDMKKRAQFPDSYTYTLLLRGLANNANQSGAAAKAIAVYHSMSAPNSRVQPSIIHTNAVLQVLARALDMDGIWGVAAKIPETGPGAADGTTYTTILNAIRQSILQGSPKGETEEAKATRTEKGVVEGRRIWEDIIGKWKNADIVMDEKLVCSMGRLLLTGVRPRDWDDVLSLVEQTMDIPRLVPRLGTLAHMEAGIPRLRLPNTPEQYRSDNDHLGPDKGPMRGGEFLPIIRQGRSTSPSSLTYVTPTNHTLTMVLEACQKVIAKTAADEYWNLLTDPGTYAIEPDTSTAHQRLRGFRQSRQSGEAVKLLQEAFIAQDLDMKPGTFRIAMSTCVRDKNNHNSLKNANEILRLMMERLPDADPKTVVSYAELALSFPLATGEDFVGALTYLQPVVKNLRLLLTVGGEKEGDDAGTVRLANEERQTALLALRKVYGVYDKLLLSNLIAEERKPPFKREHARLAAFIQRLIFNDSKNAKTHSSEEEKNIEEAKKQKPRFARVRRGELGAGEKSRVSSPIPA